MLIITITKGIPASGKSTWAKEQLRKHPSTLVRVNRDLMRQMMFGSMEPSTPENEKEVARLRNFVIERALSKGKSVIVDDTNFKDKVFHSICDIAKRIGNVQVIEKYFPVDLKEAKKRNAEREKKVPEHIIENMFNKNVKNKKVQTRTVYFPPLEQTFDPNLPSCIVVDLDGTLADNTSGRSWFDYDRVEEDDVHESIAELVRMYSKKWEGTENKIIIMSGRDEVCIEMSKDWMDVYEIPYDEVYFRKEDDRRPDDKIKRELLQENIEGRFNVQFFIDDRRKVVDMWRGLGYKVLHVDSGEF